MSNAYMIFGYGIKNAEKLIKEELLEDKQLYELLDEAEQDSNMPCVFSDYGEDVGNTIGVSLKAPWGNPSFKDRGECNKHIFTVIKHLLRDGIEFKDIAFDFYEDYITQ